MSAYRQGPTANVRGPQTLWLPWSVSFGMLFSFAIICFVTTGVSDRFAGTLDGFGMTWPTGAAVALFAFLLINARGRIVIEPEANRFTVRRRRWMGSKPQELPLDAIRDAMPYCRNPSESRMENRRWTIVLQMSGERSVALELPNSPDARSFARELHRALERARATSYPGAEPS